MKHRNIDLIKSFESPPKIVNIFSEKEIKMIQELYTILPETVFNKKQIGPQNRGGWRIE